MAKLVHNIQKKQHRERAQPTDRKRFGLLEKHKDYQLRAKDFHKKQATLKLLKSKIRARNPDEYYHAMNTKKTDANGMLVTDRGNEALTMDQVKLLKTQDANYVKTIQQNQINQLQKKKDQLLFSSTGKHTVFVDDKESMYKFSPEEYFQTPMLDKRENRLRVGQLQDATIQRLEDGESLEKKKIKKFKSVTATMEKVEQLKQVQSRMNMQREVMKNGSKKKITDDSGNVSFKWKKQRKR